MIKGALRQVLRGVLPRTDDEATTSAPRLALAADAAAAERWAATCVAAARRCCAGPAARRQRACEHYRGPASAGNPPRWRSAPLGARRQRSALPRRSRTRACTRRCRLGATLGGLARGPRGARRGACAGDRGRRRRASAFTSTTSCKRPGGFELAQPLLRRAARRAGGARARRRASASPRTESRPTRRRAGAHRRPAGRPRALRGLTAPASPARSARRACCTSAAASRTPSCGCRSACRRSPPALMAKAALERTVPRAVAGFTRVWLRLTALLGIAGVGFHAYGVSRAMGGWRNWRQNLIDGPPLPAPPSFSALALAGACGPARCRERDDALRRRARRTPATTCSAKWSSLSFDDVTRAVIARRLEHAARAPLLHAQREFRVLEAACARLLATAPRPSRRSPTAIDADLFDGRGEGFRRPDMPPAARSPGARPRGLDAEARHRHAASASPRSTAPRRTRCCAPCRRRRRRGAASRPRPAPLLHPRAAEGGGGAYYSHPEAWSEIGFGGPASPRGYVRMGLDRARSVGGAARSRRRGDAP